MVTQNNNMLTQNNKLLNISIHDCVKLILDMLTRNNFLHFLKLMNPECMLPSNNTI